MYIMYYLILLHPHHFNIACRRAEEFLAAEYFSSEGHSQADMAVMAVDQIQTHASTKHEKESGSEHCGPRTLWE